MIHFLVAGTMVICPADWLQLSEGKVVCEVPPGTALIARPPDDDKAHTEYLRRTYPK